MNGHPWSEFDKYNSRKGGNVDRAYILRGYDGGFYALDRLIGTPRTISS
jgi:hypothetical protein